MKKKIMAILMVAFVCLPLLASGRGGRERNYIYIFDCTRSMIGINSSVYTKDQESLIECDTLLYGKAKRFLHDDIIRNQAEGVSIVIIPFAQDPGKTITFESRDFNTAKWKEVSDEMDDILRSSKNTSICHAWDKGLCFIDTTKDNYFYLFTDGSENVLSDGCNQMRKRIEDWGKQYDSWHAYLVSLGDTNNSLMQKCQDLKSLADYYNNIHYINGGEHPAPFGNFNNNMIKINEMSLHDKRVGFSGCGRFDVLVECNDPHFDVEVVGGRIDSGYVDFRFVRKSNGGLFYLTGLDTYKFSFSVKPQNQDILQIQNPDFAVEVDCHERSTLHIAVDEFRAGKASYYPSFLFASERRRDTLFVDLMPEWNGRAKSQGAAMLMTLSPSSGLTFFYNGEVVENGQFVMRASDVASMLGIQFDAAHPEGVSIINIKGEKLNLETINDDAGLDEYHNTIRAKYSVRWNPLAYGLLIAGIILLGLLLVWVLVLRPTIYPAIRVGGITIQSPYYKMIRTNKVRRIVFTNKSGHQGFFSRLFTGRVIYEVNSVWLHEWSLEPSSKKTIRARGLGSNYTLMPSTTLSPRGSYTMQCNAGGQKYTFQVF